MQAYGRRMRKFNLAVISAALTALIIFRRLLGSELSLVSVCQNQKIKEHIARQIDADFDLFYLRTKVGYRL